MTRSKKLTSILATFMAATAMYLAGGLESRAVATEENQCVVESVVTDVVAAPVTDCPSDQIPCEDICCNRGDECCVPSGGTAYCAETC